MVEYVNFAADRSRRTISGLVVEWGTVARSGGRLWRFAEGSLRWSAVGRIKLNLDHDRGHRSLIGVATALHSSGRGLHGEFKIGQGAEGDRALQMAADGILDGFSVEVDFDGAGDLVEPDPYEPSVRFVRRGTLRGVALTGAPAFDSARVDRVAASRDTRIDIRMTAEEAESVRVAADAAGVSMSDLVRSRLRGYSTPRPVYDLGACPQTPSLIRDLWVREHPNEGDAFAAGDRLAAHQQYQRELAAKFTTATTGNAAEVVEPGYRPLLASIDADRPLFAAASKGDLTSGASFLIPAQVTETSVGTGVSPHTEGVPPAEGTLTATGLTVTPAAFSGRFTVTREVVDSSNPAIDALAMSIMREDWDRQAEQAIFTEVNTAQAGTITAGVVPSGAMARTSAGAALPADLRKALLVFAEVRKRRARSVVASTRTTVAEALELLDLTAFALRDVSVDMSPWITGTAAGDGDVFAVGVGDLWAWSSPLLQFNFAEKKGPELVELALYGYFATRLVNPQGLASIRHT